MILRWSLDHAVWRYAEDFYDFHHLIFFVLTRKDWLTTMHFNKNTTLQDHFYLEIFFQKLTKTPHVNFHVIWEAEKHFWASVEPWLNVAINFLANLTWTSEVDYFNLGAFWVHKEDIFRFQIAMDN